MKKARSKLRNQTGTENDTETGIGKGIEIGKGTGKGTGTENVMMGGTETEESREEMRQHHTVEAKKVMFTSDSLHVYTSATFTWLNIEHLIFFTGRKDDEMDPMDPSAYSDAPRYSTDGHLDISYIQVVLWYSDFARIIVLHLLKNSYERQTKSIPIMQFYLRRKN